MLDSTAAATADSSTSDSQADDHVDYRFGLAVAFAAAGAVAAGMLAREEEEDRKRREEERSCRWLFDVANEEEDEQSDDLPEPWEAGEESRSEHDETRPSQIDRLCELLFNGDETADDFGAAATTGSPVGIEKSTAVMAARRSRPSPVAEARRMAQPSQRKSHSRSASPRSSRILQWAITLFFGLALCLPFFGSSSPPARAPLDEVAAPAPASKYVTAKIEDLRVGDWVLARNPEITDLEREEAEPIDPEHFREMTLRIERYDGDVTEANLLWDIDDIKDGDVVVGSTIELDIAELGIKGPARVLAICPCPRISLPPSPSCQVITGTFCHQASQVLEIEIEGSERVAVTAGHRFWNHDQHAFIAASDLRVGERVLAADGSFRRVCAITHTHGKGNAYTTFKSNLEHVYCVTASGILVHNACNNPWGRRGSPAHRAKIESVESQLRAKGLRQNYLYNFSRWTR